MPTRSYFDFSRDREKKSRSSALVLALIFVSLLSVLVLGFLASIQTETFSAHSHLTGVKADVYADAGIDVAMARLYSALSATVATGGSTLSGNFWASQPGRIYAVPIGGAGANYDLSSGVSTAAFPTSDQQVDLNPKNAEGTGRLLSPPTVNGSMYVQWIYQHQSGKLNTTYNDLSDLVVGRFGFWVDDEGAKLNLNTAYDRVAANATTLNHPSRINLEALMSAVDASSLYTYRGNPTYLNSVSEIGRVSTLSSAAISAATLNAFSLTTYNHSPDLNLTNMPTVTVPLPDLNMFGQQRIMLTTQKPYADASGCTSFIDILNTESTASSYTDPGLFINLSATKVNAAVQKLNAALSQTGFPFFPAGSFQAKYTQAITTEVALDIIDYVRSAESKMPYIEPMRGTPNGTGFTLGNVSSGTILSNCGRRVYMTAEGAALTQFQVAIKTAFVDTLTSVYVPPVLPGGNNKDIAIYPLNPPVGTSMQIYDTLEFPNTTQTITKILAIGNSSGSNSTGPGAYINGGQYATFVHSWSVAIAGSVPPTITSGLVPAGTTDVPAFQNKITDNLGAQLVDYAGGTPYYYGLKLGNSDSDTTTSFCYHVNDDPIAGTLGTVSTADFIHPWLQPGVSTHAAIAAESPQQDTDSSGNVVNGMYVPAPKGTSSNPLGVVYSVAELGFVPTTGHGNNNLTWRTIRLQQQNQTGVLPDWAILDMFTVPRVSPLPSTAAADQPFVEPYFNGNSSGTGATSPYAGGKININNAAYQLIDSTTGTQLVRPLPLKALLLGAVNSYSPAGNSVVNNVISTSSTPSVDTLAANIASGTLAVPNGHSYGNTVIDPASANFYFSPYQLAEIKGIGDQGEAGEAIFRELSGLTTTRSDVFTIYTVGQAILQSSSGSITVVGERRKQLTVERVVNKNPQTGNLQVVLQPVASSAIQP